MRELTISLKSTLKLVSLGVFLSLICVGILGSSLATPIAIVLIGILLFGSAIGLAVRKQTSAAHAQDQISDPIFVNDTWILKR